MEICIETKDSNVSNLSPITKKKSSNIWKEDYINIVDYLEAKYARGSTSEEKSQKKEK